MQVIFWLQYHATLLRWELLKGWFVFHALSYVSKHSSIYLFYFFFVSIQNINTNCYIIFLKFFLSFSEFIPSQLYFYIIDLICIIFCQSFFISSWFNATVIAYWKHLISFLLMGFIVAFLFFIQSGHRIDNFICFIINHNLYAITWVASAKSRSVRGASHQPAFTGSCLTISHMR